MILLSTSMHKVPISRYYLPELMEQWVLFFRSELNRQSVAPNDIVQIETLHHADRQKTEAYIFELLLWLNYLVSQSKISVSGGNSTLSTKSQCNPTLEQSDQQSIQKDALSTLPKSSVEVSEDGAAREQQQTDEGTE